MSHQSIPGTDYFSNIYDEGLVTLVIMHTFQAPPHIVGSGALVDMDHLGIHEVALNLHVGECVIEAPVLPALGVHVSRGAFGHTSNVL